MTRHPQTDASPRRRLVSQLFFPLALALAGCGGDDDEPPAPQPDENGVTPAPSTILSQFFVESFDRFEAAATRLIEEAPRYTLQRQAWYQDNNNNDRRDPDTEPLFSTYPLKSAGIHYAHAAGLSGLGQTIAVIDDGFLPGHEVFAGKSVTEAGNLALTDHGTQVASVAAGSSDYMIGVAPGADLAFGSYETFETRAAATRLATQVGAVAQNNSWNFTNTPATQASFDSLFGSRAGRDYFSALQSYAREGVVVFAASNDKTQTRASLMPALPAIEPSLEHGWLTAINAEVVLDGDDVVAAQRISAPCLEAAAWCLAAEGTWISATAATPDSYGFATGTSFAAPMISGAMALLAEAFPDLSPHDLRIRLLASADNVFEGFTPSGAVELVDGFRHQISDEWGHGFLDVKAALLPIGQTTTTLADGTRHDVSDPIAVEGTATGDAVARALKGVPVPVDDALNARFALSAEALVAQRGQAPLSTKLQRQWLSGEDQSCCDLNSYFSGTKALGGTTEDISLRMLVPSGTEAPENYGAVLGKAFDAAWGAFSLNIGIGHDDGILLPSWFRDERGTEIIATEIGLNLLLDRGTSLELAAGMGAALSTEQNAGITFNSASAALVTEGVANRGDRLSVTLGLPVAVVSGRTSVTLPVMTQSGLSRHTAIDVELSPSQREIRLGAAYDYPLHGKASLFFAMSHAENAGNIAGERETGILVGFQNTF